MKLKIGSVLMSIGIMLGAFGAHALKKILSTVQLETFETGVKYLFIHALAIIILGILEKIYGSQKLKLPFIFFLLGIFFFSFGCVLYGLTGIKIIAMIVPIGGVAFILGWLSLFFKV